MEPRKNHSCHSLRFALSFSSFLMSYFYVCLTVALTVYGQIVIKWQVSGVDLPDSQHEKFISLLCLLFNPWVISAFLAAFLASLTWMAALSKLDLSYAYPFMSLAFVFVVILSAFLFGEPMTSYKIAGIIIVVLGLIVGAQG